MHWLIVQGLIFLAGLAYRKIRDKYADDKSRDLPEFRTPTTTEGRKEPVAYGTVPIFSPNTLWYGNTNDHTKEVDGQRIRHFWIGLQLGLCRGPVDRVSNLWVDDVRFYRYITTLGGSAVYDLNWNSENKTEDVEAKLDNSVSSAALEGSYYAKVTAHLGSETQAVDSYLTTYQSPQPAYRGLCYLVWQGFTSRMPSADIGALDYIRASGGVGQQTSLRRFSAEVVRLVNANPLGLAAGERDIGTGNAHANPMNVAADLITNAQNLNESGAAIDTTSFGAAATTLASEENGMSWLIDRPQKLRELLDIIEQQINGFIFKDPSTQRWVCKLARADYSIPALTAVNNTNITRLKMFRRLTWQGTTNQVNIEYQVYDTGTQTWRKSTFARAHDIANYEIQGRYVPVDLKFPGCRDSTLAAALAARELRARNRPLANAEVEVKRAVGSSLKTGDVVRFSYAGNLNITDLPMRVTKIDYGKPGGLVLLSLVEDVFANEAAVQGEPGDTGWDHPSSTPQAVPLDEGLAMEIPWAVAERQGIPGNLLDRIWFAAPQQTDESLQRIYTREGADPYLLDGSSSGITFPEWIYLGELDGALAQDTAQPHASPADDVTVTGLGYPGTSTDVVTRTLSQLGQNLDHLVLIGSELMLVPTIENVDGTDFKLKGIYRGVLDTVRAAHADNADVFLLPFGADHRITDTGHTQGANTNLQFRPVTIDGELPEGSANTETVSLANRGRKPYPPTELNIEATRYPTSTISLDSTTATGSGVDQVGFDASWTRRDYRTFDQIDAVGGTVSAGFPTTDTTEYRVIVKDDPDGTPATLVTGDWASAASAVVTRTDILAANDGVLPSNTGDDISATVETRHDYDSTTYEADQDESWGFEVSSTFLSGFNTNTGAEDNGVTSAAFTATDTGTYTFTIGSNVLSTGKIEAQIGAGGFVDVITSGTTSGTLPGVTALDSIVWRHTETVTDGTTPNTFLTIDGPSTAKDAYGIVKT